MANSPPPKKAADDAGQSPVVLADLKKVERHGLLTTLGTGVLAISTAFGAYAFVVNKAQAQVDAGISLVQARQSISEDAAKRTQQLTDNRLDRLEKGQERTDAKLDALLMAMRVPNPAPAPKDAGGQ